MNSSILHPLVLTALLIFPFFTSAEVYTWINSEGVREYGDEPPKDAKKASLPAIQSMSKEAFSGKKNNDLETKTESSGFSGYKKLMILNPKQNYTLETGAAGTLQVELAVEPSLQPGHEITLFLNGRPINTASQLQFTLNNLDRGSHLLHAHIKHRGTLLVSTNKRRFHVQRPSIRNRSRAQ